MFATSMHLFSGVDLFEKLVPLNVHQALTAFENRKTELVNMEIGKMRESTQLLNGWVVSILAYLPGHI